MAVCYSMLRLHLRSKLFPYTTLFRSNRVSMGGRNVHVMRHMQIAAPLRTPGPGVPNRVHRKRSEEHTSELQSRENLVCRLQLEKKKISCHSAFDDQQIDSFRYKCRFM